jgi:hypothetical protein
MEGWSLRACDEEQRDQAYRLGGEHYMRAVSKWAGAGCDVASSRNCKRKCPPKLSAATNGQYKNSEGTVQSEGTATRRLW